MILFVFTVTFTSALISLSGFHSYPVPQRRHRQDHTGLNRSCPRILRSQMPPNNQWWGMAGVWAFRRDLVRKFINSLDFAYLCLLAETNRSPSGSIARVHTDVFSAGRERIVFQIEFSDGVSWVARISLPALPMAKDDDTRLPIPGPAVLHSEVAVLQLVARTTSIPVPRVYAYDFDNNPLGARYMLMDEVRGKLIRPFPSTPLDKVAYIYGQVADIVLELAQTRFPKIGMISVAENSRHHVSQCVFEDFTIHPAFSSANAYYMARFQSFLDEKKREMPPTLDWVVFAWLCVQSISHFVIPELDGGPFPLAHPDLNNGNILYDENEHIVGVLDWTGAGAFPWELVMVPPMDLYPGYYEDRRELYIDVFEMKEKEKTGNNRFATFMRSPAALIIHLVNDNHRSWGKTFPSERAHRLANLVFGEGTTWEDVTKKYSGTCI